MEAQRLEKSDLASPRPAVHELRPDERKPALEAFSRAFVDDPLAMYLFPDDRTRTARWARFAAVSIDYFGGNGIVLTNEHLQGLSIWRRPSPTPVSLWTQLLVMLRTFAISGRNTGRALKLDEFVRPHRPSQPHYYLSLVGTDPAHQGKGVGSALLQPVLRRCDQERMPAFLESSKEKNLPFYQKHGFEVVDALEIRDGPRIFTMLRPAP